MLLCYGQIVFDCGGGDTKIWACWRELLDMSHYYTPIQAVDQIHGDAVSRKICFSFPLLD